MTPLHTRVAPLMDGGTLTFDYYTAAVRGDDLIIAAIVGTGREGVTLYRRYWRLDRWSVPTRANFEAKFLAEPSYRVQFQVDKEDEGDDN